MPAEGVMRAAKLVHIYQEVANGNGFAQRIAVDPTCFCGPEETDFLWEVVDAAFDAGVQSQDTEIERLRAVVNKLPMTADGVPVVPGMTVYHRDWRGEVTEERTSWAPPYPKVFSCCYSTREAVEVKEEG